jgi:hypothetical protein
MRKPVVPRLVGLAGLYSLIVVVLVSVQFAKKGNFSIKAGDVLVEGQYRTPDEGEAPVPPGFSRLAGEVRVIYGGLEFDLPGNSRDNREGTLVLLDEAGTRYSCTPEYLVQEEGGLRFYLTGGVDLFFSGGEGGAELRVAGNFEGDMFTGLEIPYRPLRSSRMQDLGGGRLVIAADGRSYHFNRNDDDGRAVLVLQKEGPPIVYGVAGEEKGFKVEDYILAEGEQPGPYREALGRWVDRSYALWSRSIASQDTEDLAVAYLGEALGRGAYRSALSAIPRSFLSSPRRSYKSAVYLGEINAAHRGFLTAEEEWLARITGALNAGSADVLLESRVFEYLDRLGQAAPFDQGIALIRNLDSLTLDQVPGLLEALTELRWLRPRIFDEPGIFESQAAQARHILSASLRRSAPQDSYPPGLVLAAREDDLVETGWNLRLGKALGDWGEAAGDESWAAIGRSIVLSVLALEDREGRFVSALRIDGHGNILAAGGSPAFIDTGRVYQILRLGEYRPKILALSPASLGLWSWTASPEVRVTQEGQVLDIAVRFPLGESHYMLVRNVNPFYRLQFYGMDWRTDPNFERYDSSGWVYHAPSRALILKVKHRAAVEHIRLYMGSPPPPPPPSPSAEEPAE